MRAPLSSSRSFSTAVQPSKRSTRISMTRYSFFPIFRRNKAIYDGVGGRGDDSGRSDWRQSCEVSGWAAKKRHMMASAVIENVVRPTTELMAADTLLPGQAWPPPLTT